MKRHLPPEMCDSPDDYYSQFEQKTEEDYEPEELAIQLLWESLKMEETPRESLESKAELLNAIRNWLWQERITPEELQAEIEYIQHNPLPF